MNLDLLKNLIDNYNLIEQHIKFDNTTERITITLNYEKISDGMTNIGLIAMLKRKQLAENQHDT